MKKNVTFLTILWLASCFAAFSQEEKEVKHESDPQYEVHQYLAGESAKVWPGWSGNVYSVKVTVHAIKCPKTDDWFGDNLYFKFYVNDGFRLFNKNGGYNYSRNKEGWGHRFRDNQQYRNGDDSFFRHFVYRFSWYGQRLWIRSA